MAIFLSKQDIKLSKEFEKKGYVVKNILNKRITKKIENQFIKFINKELKIKKKFKSQYLLNNIHKFFSPHPHELPGVGVGHPPDLT